MAQVEDVRPALRRFQNIIHRAVQRVAAGDQRDGVQIALHHAVQVARPSHRRAGIDGNGIHRHTGNILVIAFQRHGAWETNDARTGNRGAHLFHDFRGGLDHHRIEQHRRHAAGPAVENLHRIGAGLQLADQVEGDTFAQDIQKLSKALWIAIGPKLRRFLLVTARARRQICRQRPGRAGETQQRGRLRNLPCPVRRASCAAPHRPARSSVAQESRSSLKPAVEVTGAMLGPSPAVNVTGCPRASGTVRMSLNRIAASKPKRRMGWMVTSDASSGFSAMPQKEPAFSRTRAIFGQVAAGLAHQPDRRRFLPRRLPAHAQACDHHYSKQDS